MATDNQQVRLTIGRLPRPEDPEFREMQNYESGRAEAAASTIPGPHQEPWLNVLSFHEPGARPSLEQALATEPIRQRMTGKIVDLGAGTCWVTAELSKLDSVDEVVAVDLSPVFFQQVGTRMIRELDGNVDKIRFVAGTYEEVPEPDGTFDVALLIASIHHAIAPLRVLLEARRLLRQGGLLLMIENPCQPLPSRSGDARAWSFRAQPKRPKLPTHAVSWTTCCVTPDSSKSSGGPLAGFPLIP